MALSLSASKHVHNGREAVIVLAALHYLRVISILVDAISRSREATIGPFHVTLRIFSVKGLWLLVLVLVHVCGQQTFRSKETFISLTSHPTSN